MDLFTLLIVVLILICIYVAQKSFYKKEPLNSLDDSIRLGVNVAGPLRFA